MKKNILDVIEKYPNGSLIQRKRGEKVYYYLNHREEGKVVSTYLGTSENCDFGLLSKKLSESKNIVSYVNAFKKYNIQKSKKEQSQKSNYLHNMFLKIQAIEFFDIPELVKNAKSDEEKAFVKMVSEFSLKLKQDAAIREHRF